MKRVLTLTLALLLTISGISHAASAKQIDFLLAGYRHPTTDAVLSGGKVKTFLTGTSTLSSLWTDADKGGTATNPVVLDSAGKAEVYGDNIYKFEIYDSDDVLIETIPGLQYEIAGGLLDEDDFSSDSSTQGASQQSINAGKAHKVSNLSALTGMTPSVNLNLVYMMGYTTIGDGGQGFFRWDSSDLSTEVSADTYSGIYVAPTSDATGTSGAWIRLYDVHIDPRWFGAIYNGSTSAELQIQAASAYGPLVLTGGAASIQTDITIADDCWIIDGFSFKVATTKTLTFSGQIHYTGTEQIFNLVGTGAIAPDLAKNPWCHLEWFGAKVNDNTYDNVTHFDQAIDYFNEVKLMSADYWIQSKILIDRSHFTISGYGKHWLASKNSTRIIQKTGTADIIHVYDSGVTTTDPNTFLQETRIRDVDLLRTNLTTPASGSELAGPAGIRLQYTLYTYIDRVVASESYNGFVLDGTVRTHMDHCFAFRSTAVTVDDTESNDRFYGYHMNGNASIGLAGGNASTYLTNCTASVGGNPTLVSSKGFFNIGNFVDTFLFRPETSECATGIEFDGTGSDSTGNIDVHIIQPVTDTYSLRGLLIRDTNASGTINVVSPYAGPKSTAAAPGALGAIEIRDSLASVNITDVNLVGSPNTNALGIYIVNSKTVNVQGGGIQDFVRPFAMTGSDYCSVEVTSKNINVTTSQAAFYISNSDYNYIRPIITGAASAVTVAGVNLVGTSDYNEINTTTIDTTNISTGTKYSNSGTGVSNINSGIP